MLNDASAPKMGRVDEVLLNLDQGRRAVPGGDWIHDNPNNVVSARKRRVPFLLLVLFFLRVGLAVVRKIVPFSPELREAWSVRRRIAKLYDSYQRRMLLWIGAGVPLYIAVSGRYSPAPVALTMFDLITGAVAAVACCDCGQQISQAGSEKIQAAAA
jgi:hypothetical protein